MLTSNDDTTMLIISIEIIFCTLSKSWQNAL